MPRLIAFDAIVVFFTLNFYIDLLLPRYAQLHLFCETKCVFAVDNRHEKIGIHILITENSHLQLRSSSSLSKR